MLPFVGDLNAAKIHVQAPTAVIFVCGGPYSDISAPVPLSLRDAFLKIPDNPALRGRQLIQAEDITSAAFFSDHYSDLLQFETDLAQITELILLFSESEGSLAELGAFVMVPEIAAHLLVIIRNTYWNADSFIRLGPLRWLERTHGETAICVVDDQDIGMRGQSAADVDIDTLKKRLQEPLLLRLKSARERTSFNANKAGHVIKLIVGLIQEYGALTVGEIVDTVNGLSVGVNITPQQVEAYLLCAGAVRWVVKERKGVSTYYFARNLPDAANFTLKSDAQVRDKTRRRYMIREHWRDTDPNRDRGIKEVFGGNTP